MVKSTLGHAHGWSSLVTTAAMHKYETGLGDQNRRIQGAVVAQLCRAPAVLQLIITFCGGKQATRPSTALQQHVC